MSKFPIKLGISLVLLGIILLIVLIFVSNKYGWEQGLMEMGTGDTDIELREPVIGQIKERSKDGSLHILTSIDDDVVADSMRCGTFQLVWNDMIKEVVKKDVVFNPQLKIVENLNKKTFTEKELSSKSYYSKFGLLTLDLKEEVEKGIKKKFEETSDVLDQIDWSNAPQSDDYYKGKSEKEYLFYAMLKKAFKFKIVFDQLSKGGFDNKYNNISYFGIDEDSDENLYKQVYIYYYNSDNDFAVALKTKEGEEVILARGVRGNSFMDDYDEIINKEKEYKGNHKFTRDDYLKVPELNVKTLTEFDELENEEFQTNNGDIFQIKKAIQTIELKLDEKGGEIKSEAVILASELSDITFEEPKEYRYFYFDEPYIIMLKESEKDLPYFAAQISDITLFQK